VLVGVEVSICVPHELERVDEEEQMARQEQREKVGDEEYEERRRRQVELARPRTPEPMTLRPPLEDNEEPYQ